MPNVTSYQVTGDWRHIIDDGMVDVDALPDEALPTGHVIFTPLSPRVAVAGAPAVAHTLGEVKALIAGGALTDLQGREGIWMAGKIGDQPVRWRAVTHLFYKGQKIAYPVLEFDLVDDAVLTGLIQNSEPGQPPIIVDPRIEALVREAQAALNETRTMLAEATEFHEDVEQWHGEIMPAAAQVAEDRQIAHDASALAVLAAANAGRIMGTGSPEGVKDAPIGTIYVNTANGELWAKSTKEGVTSGWFRLLSGDPALVSWVKGDLVTQRLDTVTTPGAYSQPTASRAIAFRNYPVAGVGGTLQVLPLSPTNSSLVLQIFVTSPAQETWTRESRADGSWSAWRNAENPNGQLGATDLDTVKRVGNYPQNSSEYANTANHYPESSRGILMVLDHNAANSNQWVQVYWTFPVNRIWMRNQNGASNWGAWEQVGGVKIGNPNLTVDLDTVQVEGTYPQSLNERATSAHHYPIAERGTLRVERGNADANNQFIQIYFAATSLRMFMRSMLGVGTWTSWKDLGTGGGSGGGSGATVERVDVILAIGQSNMSGRGTPVEGMIPDSRLWQFGSKNRSLRRATPQLDMHDSPAGLSPSLFFGQAWLEKADPSTRLVLVPAAHGATGFASSTWNWSDESGSASLLAPALEQTAQALAAAQSQWPDASVTLRAVLWHQGENSQVPDGSTYAAELNQLIGRVRSIYPNVPFIAGELNPENASKSGASWQAHQALAGVVERTALAHTPLNAGREGDITHLSRVGVEAIGRGMFELWPAALANKSGNLVAPPPTVSARQTATNVEVEWSMPLCRTVSYIVEASTDGSSWSSDGVTVSGRRATCPAGTRFVRVATVSDSATSRFTAAQTVTAIAA